MADLNKLVADMGTVLDEIKSEHQLGTKANQDRLVELTAKFDGLKDEVVSLKDALAEEKRQAQQHQAEQKQKQLSFGQTLAQAPNIIEAFKKKSGNSGPVEFPVNPLDQKALTYAPLNGDDDPLREVSSDIRQWGSLYNYPNILRDPLRPPTIRERLNVVPANDRFIQYCRETSLTNAFAVVAETTSKPESAMAFALEQANIVTIASWVPAPLQLISDMPRFRNYVESRMLELLAVKLDGLYLYGAGGGAAINGILTDADIETLTQAEGQNRYETIREAMVVLEENHYMPDTLVIHPRDRYRMEVQKGEGDGQYILMPWMPAGAGPGVADVLKIPVVSSTVIEEGTALLGNFKRGATLFTKDGVRVAVSFEHSDYFIRNMMAIRVECDEQLVIEYPKMFCKINWLGTTY